jgi:hypothetical protein
LLGKKENFFIIVKTLFEGRVESANELESFQLCIQANKNKHKVDVNNREKSY